MPEVLRGKYQNFTQADLTRLRRAGYSASMLGVDEGVTRYVESLISASAFDS
jgi:ADP-L-glycero-D-manno-heptose 6-epimerase